mmetsp:Transcript_127844/g.368149  ORF Transcript_127844/g.368149 Transcript_127844/m.368149 type:complete len:203 (+) Transcript_127844:5131-5739(+)
MCAAGTAPLASCSARSWAPGSCGARRRASGWTSATSGTTQPCARCPCAERPSRTVTRNSPPWIGPVGSASASRPRCRNSSVGGARASPSAAPRDCRSATPRSSCPRWCPRRSTHCTPGSCRGIRSSVGPARQAARTSGRPPWPSWRRRRTAFRPWAGCCRGRTSRPAAAAARSTNQAPSAASASRSTCGRSCASAPCSTPAT